VNSTSNMRHILEDWLTIDRSGILAGSRSSTDNARVSFFSMKITSDGSLALACSFAYTDEGIRKSWEEVKLLQNARVSLSMKMASDRSLLLIYSFTYSDEGIRKSWEEVKLLQNTHVSLSMKMASDRSLVPAGSSSYTDEGIRKSWEEVKLLQNAHRRQFWHTCSSVTAPSLPAKASGYMADNLDGSGAKSDSSTQSRILHVRGAHQDDGSGGEQNPWRQPAQLNPDDDDSDDHFGFRMAAHLSSVHTVRDHACLHNRWSGCEIGFGSRRAKSQSVGASTIAMWRAAIRRTCIQNSGMRSANRPHLHAMSCRADSYAWGRGRTVLCGRQGV
jgi:hypothetical protein